MNTSECHHFDLTGFTPTKPVLVELIAGTPKFRTLYVLSYASIEDALRAHDPFYGTRPCLMCRGTGLSRSRFTSLPDGTTGFHGELCECETGLRALLKIEGVSGPVSIGWSER